VVDGDLVFKIEAMKSYFRSENMVFVLVYITMLSQFQKGIIFDKNMT